jgi:TrwC relaxase
LATGRWGLFEVDAVPEFVVRHFSQRRVEIENRATELVAAATGGVLSRERMQGIALATRRPKDYAVDGVGWREQARARAADTGSDRPSRLSSSAAKPVLDVQPDPEGLAAGLSGPDGLTRVHNTFAPACAGGDRRCVPAGRQRRAARGRGRRLSRARHGPPTRPGA